MRDARVVLGQPFATPGGGVGVSWEWGVGVAV